MALRRKIIIATASENTRSVLHAFFPDAQFWMLVDVYTGLGSLKAAQRYSGEEIALFFMDATLLDEDGRQAIQLLQSPATVDCPPVVLLMPQGDRLAQHVPENQFISEVLEMPVDPRVAKRRIRMLLDLHDYQKKDVSFQHAISRDPLLGLLSGKSLGAKIDGLLSQPDHEMGLLVSINIDNMRAINERSGHHFGDRVLVDAAKTIAEALPPNSIIGRPYSDTFCAFIPNLTDKTEGIARLEALRRVLNQRYPEAPGGEQEVSACLGAVFSPEGGKTFQELQECAEIATSAAKQRGRNVLIFYSEMLRNNRLWKKRVGDLFAKNGDTMLPLQSCYMPILMGDGASIAAYDYLSLPVFGDGSVSADANLLTGELSEKSRVHVLRVEVKKLFGALPEIAECGIELPEVSLHAMLTGEQSEMLPHVLQEALAETPLDASKISINVSQDLVLSITRSQLTRLASDVRAMGFKFGIHSVGEAFIANTCYLDSLFDRILFTKSFTNDLFSGVYPPEFLEHLLQYFVHLDTFLCFPAQLSLATRSSLHQTLGARFGYYGTALETTASLVAHMQTHAQHQRQPLPQKRPFFRISEDRYNEIFSKSGIVLFDWRPHDERIAFSESFDVLYGAVEGAVTFEEISRKLMHPEDVPRFDEALLQVKHGRPYAEGVFRMFRKTSDGHAYFWRRIFLLSIAQDDGIVTNVYGISFDVDREQREMQSIKRQAERDPLTQLYNRGATEGFIQRYLESEGREGQHALMLVDIDDFKTLNDTYGHIEGDKALQFFATQMKTLFRKDDIVGRIGGDEFMVFLKNISSEAMIASRAEDLCRVVKMAVGDWHMTCTVGVARYPAEGQNFHDLYNRADLALYQAKESGKDKWTFFTSSMDEA